MAYNWNWEVFLQPSATGDDTYLGWLITGFGGRCRCRCRPG